MISTVGSSVHRASSHTVWSNLFIKLAMKRYRMVVACLPRCCIRGSIGAPRVLLRSVENNTLDGALQNTTPCKITIFPPCASQKEQEERNHHGVQSLTCPSNVI